MRCEPCVRSIKRDKDILHKISSIWCWRKHYRERKREKGQGFLRRFTGFHRSEVVEPRVKVLRLDKATHSHQKGEISPKIQKRIFGGN